MSIIYEALRKTQRNREVRNMPTRERMAARNLDWLDKALVVFILLLLLVIMFLYLPHIFKHRTVQQAVVTPKPITTVAAPVVQAASVNAEVSTGTVAPPPEVPNNLTLNGVLLSSNEKIALINKKTFHVGDNVEGMKLIKIEFDSVELDNQGRIVTLRTSS